ncbi:hypothetical protein ST201phi2-1p396 [Pseudomonas phage 201phi2-1]|uniref:Uncharacterized protein n=1 Tax=Pseudomonas phage 201phi2-1 TaxID=198110 RepID=B3FJQ5_BP201|nr:hypothetical protein ST201phi2-1p396 [Pseudomonas phage 201phi2-1]ABY63220.1 hypothetical protein 201phi2-1p396 [Pseudomonas phage 201phi2-1]
MQHYGMVAQKLDQHNTFMETGRRPSLPGQQYKVEYLESADNLYSVTSDWQGFPNFMVWNDDLTVIFDPIGHFSSKEVFDIVSGHMANMTDEERKLFDPILIQLITLNGINQIVLGDDFIEIYTHVAGKQKLLLVTVMNMIDTSERSIDRIHWRSRSTLN